MAQQSVTHGRATMGGGSRSLRENTQACKGALDPFVLLFQNRHAAMGIDAEAVLQVAARIG